MQVDPISWSNLVVQGACFSVPVILTQLFTHRQSRNDSKKRDEKMGFILSEHIPHTHGERQGALFAEGIRFPRGMNGK